MEDKHFESLMRLEGGLAKNTETTANLVTQITQLNCRVAKNSQQLGKVTTALLIIGTAVTVLLITNGSKFVDFLKGVVI